MPIDTERARAAVAELLEAIGDDPTRPGLAETPRLVAEAYAELFAGVGADAAEPLRASVPVEAGHEGELVLVRDLVFRSMCEHHLLPFSGVAHVAYLPGERLVGLGRLPRALEVLAARPQLQERLGEQFVDVLTGSLEPRGALVVLEARHECVAARGPRQAGASTVTVAARGALADPAAQSGVLALVAGGAS